ncbi:DUF1707 SHOCT-like domain-containing protein [Actinopolymorpha pittospori]
MRYHTATRQGVRVCIERTPVRRPRLIGDEERQSCAELLAVHHARGRLSPEEFEERLGLPTPRRPADIGGGTIRTPTLCFLISHAPVDLGGQRCPAACCSRGS